MAAPCRFLLSRNAFAFALYLPSELNALAISLSIRCIAEFVGGPLGLCCLHPEAAATTELVASRSERRHERAAAAGEVHYDL